MQTRHFVKAGLLSLFLVIAFFVSWEFYLRNKKVNVAFDDGPALWSHKRGLVYQPAYKATVFIGSSRIKYDLDIDTWRKRTGEDAVQLAMEGSSPLPALDDLAADKDFKGKLVIDVTEGLFFSSNPRNFDDPNRNIAYYKDLTPAKKFSFKLNKGVESKLVFLDRDNYSLTAFLDKLRVPNRPGVFAMPIFPMEFGRTSFDRQALMTDEFVKDTSLQRRVTNIWEFFRSVNKTPPASGALLDSFFIAIKNNVDKIRARGGQVIFVRTPSSNPMRMGEQKAFPRSQYWDSLLTVTGCAGIHFEDYPEISNFVCPEWSHLSPADAIVFTNHFVDILAAKGWKFTNLK
jgi:hypothetical protein